MNTKTMRLPPRRVLTPSSTTNKRKERDEPRPKPTNTKLPTPVNKPIPRPTTSSATTSSGVPSNHLLAGYLAHEYLTKGTLMGQPWAPSGEKLKGKEEESTEAAAAATPCRRSTEDEKVKERYAEVAGLLKGGGTHLPGVVNPTQLARFLHL
ncbi:hypothetical protein TanjilG_32413 [Lupinus angustifolius]|uniref:uncharacterized protein LOC109335157 n=1 Tax=Lupinus angustifolius TaxID=3871 RepID=UPI00090EAB1F|nr:PREDICTED: uncharacterized protein LOC109335157 [Lupinus angustifolius]OIV90536.1 hypothetical protein TanjilG_32413 [Lupinus angustifolius]